MFPCHHHPTHNPALWSIACACCSAHSASWWVSTCWRHQRSSTQEMWLQSLQQGRKWATQERKDACAERCSQSGAVTWLLAAKGGFWFAGRGRSQCYESLRLGIHRFRSCRNLSPSVCIPLYPEVIHNVCIVCFHETVTVIGKEFLEACFFGLACQIRAPWTNNCRGRAPGISLTWPAFHKVRWLWSVSPCLMRWHFLGTNAVLSKQRTISLGVLSQDLGCGASKGGLEDLMHFKC